MLFDDVLIPIVWRVDIAERETRSAQARAMISDLERRGVALVATSFVDNSGIARVKSVPLRRLPQLAAWGVGFSPSFDYFRFDDWLAAPATGEGPVDAVYRALEGINAVVVGIMVAAALYMMKDFRAASLLDIALNLVVITATWALLNYSRLPSPVIVMIWMALGGALILV